MTSLAPRTDHRMGPAKKASWSPRRVLAGCLCIVLSVPAVTIFALAGLAPMADTDMEAVCGSAGIRIAVKDIQIFNHIDVFRYCDPCGDYIEFQDFMMHGVGDVATFNLGAPSSSPPYYYFGSYTNDPPPSGLIFFDVAEPEVAPVNDWYGYAFGTGDLIHRGMTLVSVPYWDQELAYTIDNVILFDHDYPNTISPAAVDLGSFYIGLIDRPRFYTYTSPPLYGSGFDFQSNFQMTIDTMGYAYNTSCDTLEFGPIYIGGDFTDLTGDDPRYPTTWKPNQTTRVDFGEFQIGDLFGDITNGVYSNPAGFDVGERDLDGAGPGPVLGYLNLSLPMEGSLRFESATFDGTDFGPGAIDGLHVHRLDLMLIP